MQEEPRIGRDKLKKGIKYFRSIYPDICFTVQEGTACTDSQKVSQQPQDSLMKLARKILNFPKRARPSLEAATLVASRTRQLLMTSMPLLQGVCEVEHVRDL